MNSSNIGFASFASLYPQYIIPKNAANRILACLSLKQIKMCRFLKTTMQNKASKEKKRKRKYIQFVIQWTYLNITKIKLEFNKEKLHFSKIAYMWWDDMSLNAKRLKLKNNFLGMSFFRAKFIKQIDILWKKKSLALKARFLFCRSSRAVHRVLLCF